jgi:hypothetical protein
MLLGEREQREKPVAVVSRNPQLGKLIDSILEDWSFHPVDDPRQAKVVFIEYGIEPPDVDAPLVRLTPLPMAEGSFLTIPISLTRLFHLLEVHFFPTPRRHIRVSMAAEVELGIDNDWFQGRLVSLSDRGGRILHAHEVPRGKQVKLGLKMEGERLLVPAEVIYCVPAGDSPGRQQPNVGVLFKPERKQLIDRIRHFIEKSCLERACEKAGISRKDSCLSWIDV